MRVLLLEDDPVLARTMIRRLRRCGMAVDDAESLDEASWLLTSSEYDCVVMDRMVPGGDAMELLEKLRAMENAVPVLVVTGLRTAVGERVAGFEAGADDYLVKPFSIEEFGARVLALCRRKERPRPPMLRAGGIVVDTCRRLASLDGAPLCLTAKELGILELLVSRLGEVIGRNELVECCWGERESPFSNVVDVHVASLRQKLGMPGLIRTHRGLGYSLDTTD
jgi:two-component system, OmpR family, response regulator